MLHLAYLLLGSGGAALGAYIGYSAGIAAAYYGMRLLAAHAQDHH